MMKHKWYIGPHILDGITELLVALFILVVAVIPQLNTILLPINISVMLFRFVVPIVLMFALFLIGILTSWQYLWDRQKADLEYIQIQFQADGSRIYGWWKKYRAIQPEDKTLYVPLNLFELMKRDRGYTLEYWPRSGIVVRIENAESN